jgi:DNA topoisomerase I
MSYITRQIKNNKFYYKGANKEDIDRIKSLKIPPMWSNVKIDKNIKSKIQATGYDTKNRKQYIYHKDFIENSKKNKFIKMNSFDYNKYSRVTKHYIAKKDLSRDCVLANVIKLMEDLCIRVGNDAYKKENGTHGICTLLKSHIKNNKILFIGKKGISHEKTITNPDSIDFVKRVLRINGPYLFYDINGTRIHSTDLNDFLKNKVQSNITCKDIRTYCANKIFRRFMDKIKRANTEKERKTNVIKGIDHTANVLGNTRKVCKDSYLCPSVINKYI